MKKLILFLVVLFLLQVASGQYTMRPVEQLINTKDPGWDILKQWIDSATNSVEILPVDTAKARDALYKTQVTSRSIMGAIVFSTGGILIDSGWIRILGSGSPRMQRSLPDWNKGKAFSEFGDRPEFFLIADDAVGGFFAINYGSFGNDIENIYYLSPDHLEWESLEMNYEDFIWFCLTGNLNKFYTGIRWTSWKKDIRALKGDEVFHVMPPMWTKEGKDIEKSFRKPVPVEEQFIYNQTLRKQLGL